MRHLTGSADSYPCHDTHGPAGGRHIGVTAVSLLVVPHKR